MFDAVYLHVTQSLLTMGKIRHIVRDFFTQTLLANYDPNMIYVLYDELVSLSSLSHPTNPTTEEGGVTEEPTLLCSSVSH